MPDVTPLYQTVNTDGSIDFRFPGGLTIPIPNGTAPPEDTRIDWVRDTDGALVAQVYAQTDSSDEHNTLYKVQDPDNLTRLAQIAQTVSEVKALSEIHAGTAYGLFATTDALLIDSAGKSSFPRLPAHALRVFNAGVVTVNAGVNLAVAHGLVNPDTGVGIVPISVVATNNHGGGIAITPVITAVGAVNFNLQNNSAANSNFFWMAFG